MQASLHSMTMIIECKNILVHKSPNGAMSGQMMLMTYYKYLNAPQHVVNHFLGPPIQAAQNFIQTTLFR
jgi:hypothetical protein